MDDCILVVITHTRNVSKEGTLSSCHVPDSFNGQLKAPYARGVRHSKLSVASCELSVVSWFLSVSMLQDANILFTVALIVVHHDIYA